MQYLESSHHTLNGINSFNITRPGRNLSSGVHIPAALDENQHVSTKDLTAALKATVARMPAVSKPLSEEGWKERAVKELEPLASAARKTQKTAIARENDLESRRREWLAGKIPSDQAAELRAYARTQKAPDVLRLATKNGVIANAVLQMPHGIAGLDDPALVAHIERAAMLHNIAAQYEGQTAKVPSADSILAHGVDQEALKQTAEKALKNFEQWREDVSTVESILSQTINFYAIAADMNRTDAFDAMGLGA